MKLAVGYGNKRLIEMGMHDGIKDLGGSLMKDW
jgi:hypothetical protein